MISSDDDDDGLSSGVLLARMLTQSPLFVGPMLRSIGMPPVVVAAVDECIDDTTSSETCCDGRNADCSTRSTGKTDSILLEFVMAVPYGLEMC